jgi:hypothetical protein
MGFDFEVGRDGVWDWMISSLEGMDAADIRFEIARLSLSRPAFQTKLEIEQCDNDLSLLKARTLPERWNYHLIP